MDQTVALPADLRDLPRILESMEGYAEVLSALAQGRAATIDGAWNSSASLVAADLALHTGKEKKNGRMGEREKGRKGVEGESAFLPFSPSPLLPFSPSSVLVVLAHPRDVDFWIEDLYSFSGLRSVVFPAWDTLPNAETVIDEVGGQRLRVLRQLEADTPPQLIVTTFQALLQPVPDRERLAKMRRRIRVGANVDLEELTAWLVKNGYQRMEAIELPGEFSRRGGILDVFSPDAEVPYRLEFLGDEIESIRPFAIETQRSMDALQAIEIAACGLAHGGNGANAKPQAAGHFADYLPSGTWTILVEPSDLEEQGKHYLERVPDVTGLFSIPGVFKQLMRFPSVHLTALPSPSTETTCHLRIESVERFSGNVTQLKDELDKAATGRLRADRLPQRGREASSCRGPASPASVSRSNRLRLVLGQVRAGFRMVARLRTSARRRVSERKPQAGA